MRLPFRRKSEPALLNVYNRLDLPEDYVPDGRQGENHPLVFAVIDWLAQNARKVRPVVHPDNHPALRVVTADLLENAMSILLVEGAVSLVATRDTVGFPTGLSPVPSDYIRDAGGRYEVFRLNSLGAGMWQRVARRDVFTIRLRNGKSPLRALTQDLLTENEAAEVTIQLLKNRGILGLVVSPAPNQPPWPPNVTQQIRDDINARTAGSKRGSTIAIAAPVQVQSHTVTGMYDALTALRHIPEEHVTAVFHVPAAVIGFGTGVEQTAVGATLSELRTIAWDDGLLPRVDRLYSGLETWLMGRDGFNTPSATLGYTVKGVGIYAERRRQDLAAYSQAILSGIYTAEEVRQFLAEE